MCISSGKQYLLCHPNKSVSNYKHKTEKKYIRRPTLHVTMKRQIRDILLSLTTIPLIPGALYHVRWLSQISHLISDLTEGCAKDTQSCNGLQTTLRQTESVSQVLFFLQHLNIYKFILIISAPNNIMCLPEIERGVEGLRPYIVVQPTVVRLNEWTNWTWEMWQ